MNVVLSVGSVGDEGEHYHGAQHGGPDQEPRSPSHQHNPYQADQHGEEDPADNKPPGCREVSNNLVPQGAQSKGLAESLHSPLQCFQRYFSSRAVREDHPCLTAGYRTRVVPWGGAGQGGETTTWQW